VRRRPPSRQSTRVVRHRRGHRHATPKVARVTRLRRRGARCLRAFSQVGPVATGPDESGCRTNGPVWRHVSGIMSPSPTRRESTVCSSPPLGSSSSSSHSAKFGVQEPHVHALHPEGGSDMNRARFSGKSSVCGIGPEPITVRGLGARPSGSPLFAPGPPPPTRSLRLRQPGQLTGWVVVAGERCAEPRPRTPCRAVPCRSTSWGPR
jgi:hypothetical protein